MPFTQKIFSRKILFLAIDLQNSSFVVKWFIYGADVWPNVSLAQAELRSKVRIVRFPYAKIARCWGTQSAAPSSINAATVEVATQCGVSAKKTPGVPQHSEQTAAG